MTTLQLEADETERIRRMKSNYPLLFLRSFLSVFVGLFARPIFVFCKMDDLALDAGIDQVPCGRLAT